LSLLQALFLLGSLSRKLPFLPVARRVLLWLL
jgi:hypothetical protein